MQLGEGQSSDRVVSRSGVAGSRARVRFDGVGRVAMVAVSRAGLGRWMCAMAVLVLVFAAGAALSAGAARGLSAGCPTPGVYHAGLLDSLVVDASSSQTQMGDVSLAPGEYLMVVCGTEQVSDGQGNVSEHDAAYCFAGAGCSPPAADSPLVFGPQVRSATALSGLPYQQSHVYAMYFYSFGGSALSAANRVPSGDSASGLLTIDVFALQAAPADSAAQIVAFVNAQRRGDFIPAEISVGQTMSQGCADYDSYMQLNGTFGGGETFGQPGYTQLGAQTAKGGTVIYNGGNLLVPPSIALGFPGWNFGNPFESAPNHLAALLAPRLAVMGADDDQDPSLGQEWICATTTPGYTRPAPSSSTVYTYPGDGAHIYPAETALELPGTPGQSVGIPAGTTTGPYLIVFADGPLPAGAHSHIQSASLTGPAGPVKVLTVDHSGGWAGGFVIPVSPLANNTTYGARVVLRIGGVTLTHTWSFTAVDQPDAFGNYGGPYTAASATGPGSTTVSGAKAAGGVPAAPAASLRRRPSVQGQTVVLRITCSAPPCAIAARETTVERLAPDGRIVAIAARQRTVIVGRLVVTIHHRTTVTLTVPLKPVGQRLVSQFGKLSLRLTVTAASQHRTAHLLAALTLTISGLTARTAHILRVRARCRGPEATCVPLKTRL